MRRLIEPELHIFGFDFQSELLHSIDNIEFRSETQLGEILTRGRYKGKQAPYGSCELIVPSYVDIKDSIFWMAEFIFMHKEKIELAGASDMTFWIYWHGIQGNMSFTPKEIRMISKTNVPLCIDYIQLTEEKKI